MTITLEFDAAMARIAAAGARWSGEVMQLTRSAFTALVAAAPWSGRAFVADIEYGPHPRQRLDVYAPDTPASGGAPIAIFLHGGGFIAGDKNSDGIFYCNVGRYLAAHGMLGVTANYRLATTDGWPSGREDVAAIIDYVGRHAPQYGGDPDRIILIGQSAGACHVASYLFGPETVAPSICGAIMMSGFYEAAAPLEGGLLAYFGPDESRYRARSPITHVASGHPSIMLSVAEHDPVAIATHTLALARALAIADGHAPELHWFRGHNHVSTVHAIGLGTDAVGVAWRDFIDRALAARQSPAPD